MSRCLLLVEDNPADARRVGWLLEDTHGEAIPALRWVQCGWHRFSLPIAFGNGPWPVSASIRVVRLDGRCGG